MFPFETLLFVGYLCPPSNDEYEIEFTRFRIRDTESSTVLFEINKPSSQTLLSSQVSIDARSDPVIEDEANEADQNDADDEVIITWQCKQKLMSHCSEHGSRR